MARTYKDSLKSRNWDAVRAHLRPGAGAHGGGKRQQNRKNRQKARLDLRRGEYA